MSPAPRPRGLVLAPFRALRYRLPLPGGLAAATAPPYDVIDEPARAALVAASAHNVVHLTLPQPTAAEPDRYQAARRTLACWREDGTLRVDADPILYVYEQREAAGHVQRGLVGSVALSDAKDAVVFPHENTMSGPVTDRLALTAATEANLEPILLLTDGGGPASTLVSELPGQRPPLFGCTTNDGTTHSIWAESRAEVLAAVAGDLLPRRAVIADGHHRYQTALRHQADRRAAGDGTGPWDFTLAMLVDSTQFGPRVEPIHRVLAGLTGAEARRRAGQVADLTPLTAVAEAWLPALDAARAAGAGPVFILADEDAAVLVRPRDAEQARAVAARNAGDHSAAYLGLDVSLAHHWLIADVLGTPDREESVGYAHDVSSALAAAHHRGGTAVLLAAPAAADVMAVAAAGERMPRKSTLFVPKPRSGLLMRAFIDQRA